MKVFFFCIVCVLFCSITESNQDKYKEDSKSDVIQPMRDEPLHKRTTFVNPKKAHRCGLPLGMEDGRITDHQITASSNASLKFASYRGRLGTKKDNTGYGAWASKSSGSGWLQVDLGDVSMVTKVATQGRQDADQWVKTYYLMHSIDDIHWVYYRDIYSNTKVFSGNSDRDTIATNTLKPPIYARYVRFVVASVHGHACMRAELYGCRNVHSCSIPLGMEDKRIPDNAITASYHYSSHYPKKARLNQNIGGWCTGTSSGQWLQIDLGEVKTVTKVATQGYSGGSYWTKYYYLEYSVNGLNWAYYRTPNTGAKYFPGNSYQYDTKTNKLQHNIVARFVRFRPQTYNNWYCLRVELYGCKQERTCLDPLGVEDFRIRDDEITASSQHGSYPSYRARLNVYYGWIAGSYNKNQWLQVNLRSIKKVTAVATQGYYGGSYWVTTYKLTYSVDALHWITIKENGIEKVFPGNADAYTVITKHLYPAIYARYVRFRPMSWSGSGISMRVEIYGCQEGQRCSIPVGMEDGRVDSGAITASSVKNAKCSTNHARLNSERAWCPASGNNNNNNSYNNGQWLQIHLPYLTMIKKIATQGNQDADQWITSYSLLYSLDGKHWNHHRHHDGKTIKVFSGNADRNSVVIHKLHNSIEARYVRFVPMTWHNHAAMRVEMYGCHAAHNCKSPLGMEDGRIRHSDLKSSSNLNVNHDPRFSRLNSQDQYAWCASSNNSNHWLQIDLRITKTVTKIALQGVSLGQVKSYTLAYGVTEDHWVQYKQYGIIKTFLGNYNAESVVYQEIKPAIHARFIRIQPSSWVGNVCLRTELYGCLVEGIGE